MNRSLLSVAIAVVGVSNVTCSGGADVEVVPLFPGQSRLIEDGRAVVPSDVRLLWMEVSAAGMSSLSNSHAVQPGDEGVLKVTGIPPGKARRVVVEGRDADGRVLYQGSTSLDVAGGSSNRAAIDLEAPFEDSGETHPGVAIVDDAGQSVDSSASATVRLALALGGASSVIVANDQSFTLGRTEFRLTQLQSESQRFFVDAWDLDAGLDTTTDGARLVFARFRNADGVESQIYSAQVALDTVAPAIASAASLRRCDGEVVQGTLWAKLAGYGCSFDCAGVIGGTDDGAPIRLTVGLAENVVVSAVTVEIDGGGRFEVCAGAELSNNLVALYTPLPTDPEVSASNESGAAILASVQDGAGNQAQLELGHLLFSFTAPPSPDVDSPGCIIYGRRPYGAEGSANLPAFEVIGNHDNCSAGAVTGGHGVLISSSPATGALRLGESVSDAAGDFVVDLERFDRPEVWAAAIDPAGNVGASVRVRDVHWVATLGNKESGSEENNPHRFDVRPPDAVASDLGNEPEAPALLSDSDGELLEDGTLMRWSTSRPVVSGRNGHAVVYDVRRGTALMVGGYTDAGYSGATYQGGGSQWQSLPIPEGMPPRGKHAMVYDAQSDRVVLFGGNTTEGDDCHSSAQAVCNDTWVWDGEEWSVVVENEIDRPSNPAPRASAAAAHDLGRGQTILFGGWHSYIYYFDFPCGNGVTEDSNLDCYFGKTWRWAGDGWADVTPSDSNDSPSPRYGHSLIYDQQREELLLFGGRAPAHCGGVEGTCNDVWSWDGSAWVDETPEDPDGDATPEGRTLHAMAYDPVRGRAVLFGGMCGVSNCGDTWEWLSDGRRWVPIEPLDPEHDGDPSPRSSAAMYYDPTLGGVVLLGGNDWDNLCSGSGGLCDDSWLWTGSSWRRIGGSPLPNGTSPSIPRIGLAVTYHPAEQTVVLFGGRSTPAAAGVCRDGVASILSHSGTSHICQPAQLRRWNEVAAVWDDMTSSDGLGDGDPRGRSGAILRYDAAREVLLLYGGSAYNAGENLPCGDGLVSNSNHTCFLHDTWEWHHGTGEWRAKATDWDTAAGAHPPFGGAAATFDHNLNAVILFGGTDTGFTGDDCGDGRVPQGQPSPHCSYATTWMWDGSEWNEITPSGDNPPPRSSAAMAFDRRRNRAVLFGGSLDESPWAAGDVWEWDGSQWAEIVPSDPEDDGNPRARRSHTMHWDAGREVIVLLGGENLDEDNPETGTRYHEDAWDWDGSSWARHPDVLEDAGPVLRTHHEAVYDEGQEGALVIGNIHQCEDLAASGDCDGTHLLAGVLPTHVFDVDVAAADVPQSGLACADTATECLFRGIDVVWDVGATTESEGTSTPGAALEVWRLGRWQALAASHSSPFDAPQRLGATLSSVAEISETMLDNHLRLRATPEAPGGSGKISTDYVEVTLRYRLPLP